MISLLNTSAENAVINNNHFKTRQPKAVNARLMKFIYNALMVTLLLLPISGHSAVPDEINYQGLLEDDASLPITGSVNFDFAIFDALTDGTQLWAETQTGVSVVDGMYSIALGSNTPLTATILTGGTVYLETTINGETLLPRERLLAVPYALRAQEADNVGGISNTFVQQIFQYGNHDGGGPANDDPREGLIDTDDDGEANFIDQDNDNDGYSDSAEIINGTDINLVTPNIQVFTGPISGAPDEAIFGESNLFAITGSGFLSGLTVQVGPENPVPQNLTSTSFDIDIGVGQVIGQQNLIVTLPNGETNSAGPISFIAGDKIAFVSSGTLANALSQTTATADAFCATAATNAGLSGSFVAWYSDSTSNAKDRLPIFSTFKRIDGSMIATSLADLTDGSINTSISIDEYGTQTLGVLSATHTLPSGDLASDSCTGSNPTVGIVGRSSSISGNWTQSDMASCTSALRFYCFEQ